MPSLSHKKLHGRSHMVRALMKAGQFAHLPQQRLEEALDALYNIEWRLTWEARRDARAGWAEEAVSIAFVKAAESRIIPARSYYDARTIHWIAHMEGSCCCLCLGDDGARAPYGIPVGLISFLCPTFLRIEGYREVTHPPLCAKCAQMINAKLWREYGFRGPGENRVMWSATLAWLASNKTFRERVAANAANFNNLRFDPRRVPS